MRIYGCGSSPMSRVRRMEMDLRLKGGPLPGLSDQKNYFCFNCLDINFVTPDSIHVTPHIQLRRGIFVPPSISIIPAFATCRPTEPQTTSYYLLRCTHIDRLTVDTHDVEFRKLQHRKARKLVAALGAKDGKMLRSKCETISLWAVNLHYHHRITSWRPTPPNAMQKQNHLGSLASMLPRFSRWHATGHFFRVGLVHKDRGQNAFDDIKRQY